MYTSTRRFCSRPAVGAGTGALIGKKMDKAAAEAKQIEGAQVEQITDNNGLQAVKEHSTRVFFTLPVMQI